MTRAPAFTSLRGILLAAFLLVAGAGVAVLSVTSWVTSTQDAVRHERLERQHTADHTASEAVSAYLDAGGWAGADLSRAAAVAAAGGGQLTVLDESGAAVLDEANGLGGPAGASGTVAGEPVHVDELYSDGDRVGSVAIRFTPGHAAVSPVTGTWVSIAAAAALLFATAAAALLARRLVRPLGQLARTARRFASGDRSARAALDAPGEIGQLARDFDAMADQVERTEALRRQSAADIAHELRNPLACLQAGLEEVRDGLVPVDAATLERLHRQAVRLGRVVNDLDALASAADSDRLHPMAVDLAQAARDEVRLREPTSRARRVRIDTGGLKTVVALADPDRLHQIIGNVVGNAINYSRPGDEVHMGTRDLGRGRVQLVCRDTGPGMAAEDLPHAFERGWRGSPGDGEGSGLGLAVAKELTETQGGTIDLTSKVGDGTVVRLTFPAAR